MFDILNLKFKYFGFTAIIKNEYKCSYSLNTYKYLKFMNDKTATLPKNTILNFLYSTDRQVSLELLGNCLKKHTEGRYKIPSYLSIIFLLFYKIILFLYLY